MIQIAGEPSGSCLTHGPGIRLKGWAQLNISVGAPTRGLSIWLWLLTAWWLASERKCPERKSDKRTRQPLCGFLWPNLKNHVALLLHMLLIRNRSRSLAQIQEEGHSTPPLMDPRWGHTAREHIVWGIMTAIFGNTVYHSIWKRTMSLPIVMKETCRRSVTAHWLTSDTQKWQNLKALEIDLCIYITFPLHSKAYQVRGLLLTNLTTWPRTNPLTFSDLWEWGRYWNYINDLLLCNKLPQILNYLTVSMTQESRHSSLDLLHQGLSWMQSGCWPGVRSHLRLDRGRILFQVHMIIVRVQFLVSYWTENPRF